MTTNWVETTPLGSLRTGDVSQPGVVFRHEKWLYRASGRHIAQGGMGTVHELERRADDDGRVERVACKTLHAHVLHQLRTDELVRRDHQVHRAALARINAAPHPHICPTYLVSPIADNVLYVTPLLGCTLLEAISRHHLSPRARTRLFVDALDGLLYLHEGRLLHRDFTLRNILLDERAATAFVFDFDLAMSLDDIGATTYREYYRGRILGSPGYSVPPETVDPALLDSPVGRPLDVYAVGGALYNLFTDQLPYGPVQDMWGLLVRIAEGVVAGGRSLVHYPDSVPVVLRPIIERCLERDPGLRYPQLAAVIRDLADRIPELDMAHDRKVTTGSFAVQAPAPPPVDPAPRLATVYAERRDPAVTRAAIEVAEKALQSWGYQANKSLGRVKGRDIFMAVPRPELVAQGQFPDANTFPKLVTVIDLASVVNRRQIIDNWQGHFFPTFKYVRQGLMTGLYSVVHDVATNSLLLMSEYVDDPRFASQIDPSDLHVNGALALAYLVVTQVAALHARGVAHNNVHPGALLFKGLHETGTVQPAMIGLTDPSLAPEAMAADVRALAAMVLSWLRPHRVAQLAKAAIGPVETLMGKLRRWAGGDAGRATDLLTALGDGLATVDGNFEVLRRARGDLQEYALLLVSHRLYHKLWRQAPATP